ncbi:YaiI/YqxD family protein [Spirochaeta thermophila]|uniref:YaiI/YqxD family protein n=1 Tax=Winmispira thermophila TaxID=154 RepID=UPI000301EECE|nr:DUF188 domain-containing protein [Spirochaeta thermophila]
MARVRIYLDGDSCPVKVREVIFRAAARREVPVYVVHQGRLRLPQGPWIKPVKLPPAPGAADAYILTHAKPWHLVVTRDIPLAAELVERGVPVINDRGTEFTRENVRERLSVRHAMKQLRELGLVKTRSRFSHRELRAFAAVFDRVLTRLLEESG